MANSTKSSSSTTWLIAIITAIAVVAFFFLYNPKPIVLPRAPSPRPAKLYKIHAADSGGIRRLPATVRAGKRVALSFDVPGTLIELNFNEGDAVKAGQVLARLDPQDFQNNLDAAKARRDDAKETMDRNARLLKEAVIAKKVYDQSKTAYEAQEAALKSVQKAMEDTYIRAPFDGYVARREVDNHTNVQAKQPILSLQDIDQVEIIANIPEQIVANHDKKNPPKCTVIFSTVPDRKFDVTLKEFKTEADPATQTFEATFVMPQPENVNILPNMSATLVVHLDTKTAGNASIYIPVHAVVRGASSTYVWLVDPKDMVAHRRDITVGPITDNGIEVTSGLKDGDTVITAGADYVTEGMKVTPFVMDASENGASDTLTGDMQ